MKLIKPNLEEFVKTLNDKRINSWLKEREIKMVSNLLDKIDISEQLYLIDEGNLNELQKDEVTNKEEIVLLKKDERIPMSSDINILDIIGALLKLGAYVLHEPGKNARKRATELDEFLHPFEDLNSGILLKLTCIRVQGLLKYLVSYIRTLYYKNAVSMGS